MTIVRIAHVEPRPGKLPNGGYLTLGHLVVLADDAGHRAVPVWMRADPGAGDLADLVEAATRPAEETITADAPEELTARLLRAAGASVTGVDIEVAEPEAGELSPQAAVARIGLGGGAGTRHVTAALGLGLAMAAAAGAPVRLADEVLDRVAVPVPGEDLLGPLIDRLPPVARLLPGGGIGGWPVGTLPGQRPRFEPRNLDFADGLDRWDLDCGSRDEAGQDYTVAAEGGSAVLSSAVPRPAGSAALVQSIFADDYRGAMVVFRGEIRTRHGTEQAGLRLEVLRHWWRTGRPREDHGRTVSGGRHDWRDLEITALIPEDADVIRFGITLTGTGRIALRNPELRVAEPGRGA
ncbi:MAG TPA: hypothetical protein VME19_01095 [Streptosporangiaceae bacterium]|nr:hypothetical protein [Streptosporangiaceae bacterium]